MLEKLKKSLQTCPVTKKGEYHYFIHPISDGIPQTEPELLNTITDHITQNYDLTNTEKIVAIEAMGIPLATALSLKTGIPFTIIRKRSYKLPGEHQVHQETGYSQNKLYINNIHKNDKILLIDDVISTGGTLTNVIKTLEEIGADIQHIIVPIEKDNGKTITQQKTGKTINTLVKIKMQNGKVTIIE